MVVANKRGFIDWVIQRITAILIGVYTVLVIIFALMHPFSKQSFQLWTHFFANPVMIIFTLVVLISIVWHAWIGLWTVFTDYIKSYGLRIFVNIVVFSLLSCYLIWGCVAIFSVGRY